MNRQPLTTISGGPCALHLDPELAAQWSRMDFEMHMQMYHLQRLKHGIWASNQGKFVDSIEQFNSLDMRQDEEKYQRWLAAQGF